MSQVDGITRKMSTKKSLLDVGYTRVGLDDNWQSCGEGVNGSFHDAAGRPLINPSRFPDMKAFNSYAHSKGVLTGWYMNNCICNEKSKLQPNWMPQMHGDTAAIADLGWDGVKIDGCGPSHNLELWSSLLNATGRKIFIENCHDNTTFPYVDKYELHCPHHIWRISRDINAHWGSIVGNLQQMLHERVPGTQEIQISRPGCWAYPDMLEVGVGSLTHAESRSHFGLWCVTSAPLILGLDLNDTEKLASVWDIIANEEAIQVNQDWAGLAGKLVAECGKEQGCTVPQGMPALWQIWGKPLSSPSPKVGKWAVVAVNLGDKPVDFEIDFDTMGGLGGEVQARDVWSKKDLGHLSMNYPIKALQPHDTIFLTLTSDQQIAGVVV